MHALPRSRFARHFVSMQVICPSYGRTGTNSMRLALEILGFGPCYHSEFSNSCCHWPCPQEALVNPNHGFDVRMTTCLDLYYLFPPSGGEVRSMVSFSAQLRLHCMQWRSEVDHECASCGDSLARCSRTSPIREVLDEQKLRKIGNA